MPGRLNGKKNKADKAVALKYRPGEDRAPRVVAKGRGRLAEKIISIARKHDVHIHEDPDLVEVLAQLDISAEIPADLYIVVSELLVFVYSLNREKKSGPAIFAAGPKSP